MEVCRLGSVDGEMVVACAASLQKKAEGAMPELGEWNEVVRRCGLEGREGHG